MTTNMSTAVAAKVDPGNPGLTRAKELLEAGNLRDDRLFAAALAVEKAIGPRPAPG